MPNWNTPGGLSLQPSWQPKYRANPVLVAGQMNNLTPAPNYKACALVELVTVNGNQVARLRAYACIDLQIPGAGLNVQFNPPAGATLWIVDIPDANNVDFGEIATAIANGAGVVLPPPPIIWG